MILLLLFQLMVVVIVFMIFNTTLQGKELATRSFSTLGNFQSIEGLFIVFRSPDTSKVKQKMLYASSKEALRKKLDGIYTEIQCTDLSEVSYETVLDKVTRMTS